MAASLMPFFVMICEFFNGIVQPRALMPAVWAYTMYYISPFTYWVSGIAAIILPTIEVTCSESEFTRFEPPSNSTCGEYANDWLRGTKGYLENPDATSDCGYCQYADGDAVSIPPIYTNKVYHSLLTTCSTVPVKARAHCLQRVALFRHIRHVHGYELFVRLSWGIRQVGEELAPLVITEDY